MACNGKRAVSARRRGLTPPAIRSGSSCDFPRGELGAEAELGGLEGMRLGHRLLGAIQAVENQPPEKRESDLSRHVDIAFSGIVDDIHILAGLVAGDINVFAQLDVAFGAKNNGAAVAPRAEPVGRKPESTRI